MTETAIQVVQHVPSFWDVVLGAGSGYLAAKTGIKVPVWLFRKLGAFLFNRATTGKVRDVRR